MFKKWHIDLVGSVFLALVGLLCVHAGVVLANPANATLVATVSDRSPSVGEVVVVTFTLTRMDAAEEFSDWKIRLGFDATALAFVPQGCTHNSAVWDSGEGSGAVCLASSHDVYFGESNLSGNSTIAIPITLGTLSFKVTQEVDFGFEIQQDSLADTNFYYSGLSGSWQPGTLSVARPNAVIFRRFSARGNLVWVLPVVWALVVALLWRRIGKRG